MIIIRTTMYLDLVLYNVCMEVMTAASNIHVSYRCIISTYELIKLKFLYVYFITSLLVAIVIYISNMIFMM